MNEEKGIREVAALWLDDKALFVKESSVAVYYMHLKGHILPAFGDMPGHDVTEELVQQYVFDRLHEGKSQKLIKGSIITLKMVLKYGFKRKIWLPTDLDWNIRYPTESDGAKILPTLTVKDQQKLLDYVLGNLTARNLGLYIVMFTGMRIGETCALQWKDFDLERGVIHVRRTLERIYNVRGGEHRTKLVVDIPKTINSVRDIPIARQVMTLVKPLMKLVNPDFYVISNSPHPIEPRMYRNYYADVLKKLGIPHLKFHGLRHTFATRCLESKADIKTVSSILGHADVGTTMNLYMHPDDEMKKSTIERMGKLFKNRTFNPKK